MRGARLVVDNVQNVAVNNVVVAGDRYSYPVPWMSPDLFGAKDTGKGHMPSSSMLDCLN